MRGPRPSKATFFLNDNLQAASIDHVVFLGIAEDLPVAGDWNGDGVDTIGLWRPSTAQFFLSDDHVTISKTFVFGQTGDQPIAGDWDGKP